MNANRPLIFRNRDFALLWAVKVMTQAGARMFQIALIWWIVAQSPSGDQGSSGLNLGLFMVMAALPAIIFASWIGKSIDRNSSRAVLLIADSVGAVLAVLLTCAVARPEFLTSAFVMPAIYAASLLFALCQAFIEPTLNKAVPELVETKDVGSAVAFLSSTTTLASFAGAVIGALLIEKIGLLGVTMINCLSFLLSIGCDMALRFRFKTVSAEGQGADNAGSELSGWQILRDRPLIKKILLGFGAVNFFGTPLLVMMPIYTKDVLKGSATTLSLFEALVWLGILSGTFLSGRVGSQDRPLRLTALCLIGFGISLMLPGFVVGVPYYGAFLFAAGLALGIMNVRLITFFQNAIEDRYKGRFFALLQAIISFAVPVGYLVFGALSDQIWVPYLSIVQGLGVLALALFYVNLAKSEHGVLPAEGAKA